MLRKLNSIKNKKEKEVYKIISNMRIYEFKRFIEQFDSVKNWKSNGLIVLYECLAQHYGLETNWLDITSDFRIALFFATCYYDEKIKQWRPLTPEMIKEYKYGVIYIRICHDVDICNVYEILQYDNKRGGRAILPIGYQPFMRCEMQNAYGINSSERILLQRDLNFKKYIFKHDSRISEYIYNDLNKGKGIYPIEGINSLGEEINKIKNLKEFSTNAFEYAFESSEYFNDKLECLNEIFKFDKSIIINDSVKPMEVSDNRIKEINDKYSKHEYEVLNNLKSRLMYIR